MQTSRHIRSFWQQTQWAHARYYAAGNVYGDEKAREELSRTVALELIRQQDHFTREETLDQLRSMLFRGAAERLSPPALAEISSYLVRKRRSEREMGRPEEYPLVNSALITASFCALSALAGQGGSAVIERNRIRRNLVQLRRNREAALVLAS